MLRLASVTLIITTCFVIPHVAAWQRMDPPFPDTSGTLHLDPFLVLPDTSRHGPGPRAGHSMALFNDSVILFGGRGNEVNTRHNPKTYEVVNVNGSLEFKTYDQKPVRTCDDGISEEECYTIQIGTYFNDVWAYPLNCSQSGSDGGCASGDGSGWRLVHPNADMGGCELRNGTSVCTHPNERFHHTAAAFDDGTLIVYGGFSRMCEDFCSDVWTIDLAACAAGASSNADSGGGRCRWSQQTDFQRTGPGRRWRAASAHNGTRLYMFGGQRIWHGFSLANSLANRWNDTTRFDFGGYLDDLWQFDHRGGGVGTWTQLLPRESCYTTVRTGGAQSLGNWAERNDVICTIHWPAGRASAAIALHEEALWLFGGFTASYPYPHALGRGAGPGVGATSSDSKSPYPSLPSYLGDMWRYDLHTGLWTRLSPVGHAGLPAARRDHVLIPIGGALLLFGGYTTNRFLADTWLFNTTGYRWLHKESGVRALYPVSCTSDIRYDAALDGEVVVSYSVWGEPTRNTLLDGKAGRATEPVFVLQPRRRAPGWDGCRDRADNRTDLPQQLLWLNPSQRGGHAAVYSPRHEALLMYGGESVGVEFPVTLATTASTNAVGDLWQWAVNACAANCSGHGECWYGHCYCHEGFYGVDCSNATCPGDYCYYDTETHVQHCTHCCSSPYVHADDDVYVQHQRKVACSATSPGVSHGICNGFGLCMCAPPFVADDCSVRGCPGPNGNCNGHGICSVEYPVARCICDPGWSGLDCGTRLCLNNCSFPNGECINGVCECKTMLNPYNRTEAWLPYAGTDCSFVTPFAAAPRPGLDPVAGLLVAAIAALCAINRAA